MAGNTSPIFPLTQRFGRAVLTTADTSLTAPTTAGASLLLAGANGTRIDGIKVRAVGTNDASVLRVFVHDGTNYTLVHELDLAASTAATAAETGTDYTLLPINYDNAGAGVLPPYLPTGHSIYASIGTAASAGWAVSIYGGDY